MTIKGHFETITRHKLLVMKYCFACGLYEQGLAPRPEQVQPYRVHSGLHLLSG